MQGRPMALKSHKAIILCVELLDLKRVFTEPALILFFFMYLSLSLKINFKRKKKKKKIKRSCYI